MRTPYAATLLLLASVSAAFLTLSANAGAHEYKIGDLIIDHPWTRATPAGAKAAGGYAKITNNGQAPDRLVGGAAEEADKVEIHEMSVENNIMKMRELRGGLEIKPGETVELKPGSFHLMILGLKAPYKVGAPVQGALTFEKAGTVEVEFKVEAIGAKESPAADHGGHGAHKGH
jgi:copper(I)-binding protein